MDVDTAETIAGPLLGPYRAEEQGKDKRTGDDQDQHQPQIVVCREDAHNNKHHAEG
jgi:hypothetical protein